MIRGLAYMVVASLMFATMNALVFQTKLWNADESPLTASFFRVFFNLIIVIALSFVTRDRHGHKLGIRGLFGDFSTSLWLRGLFGSLSVISIFYAVHAIGIGESSFLNASSAVWVGFLSPWVLGQKNTRLGWIAIFCGLFGIYLLYQPDLTDVHLLGKTAALGAGLWGAIAYMMIAKAGPRHHPLTIVFYFVFVATIIHTVWFFFQPLQWPHDTRSWIALMGAGIAATVAQIFMTMSYQSAPAALGSAVSYAQPVFSLIFSVLIFSVVPNQRSLLGAAIVLSSGVALPFVQGRKSSKGAAA